MLAVYGSLNGSISPNVAGFSLSYSTSISQLLQAVVTAFAFLETAINSAERIEHYSTQV